MTIFYLQNTNHSWNHYADRSQTGSKGSKTGNFWPHGKILGGSSAINAMVYSRGNSRDYNKWAEMGNPSWDWDSVLKYFKKSEDNREPDIAADTKHHSIGGPLKVKTMRTTEPAAKLMTAGLVELGYETIIDINADKYIGIVAGQATIDGFRRSSSAKAFLIPAKNRPNLHIVKHAHVTTIDFNADKSVSQVNFVLGDEKIKLSAKARKELILSAGALGTPQILLNSGIGPTDHLMKFNIKTIENLPVGKNLQDHIMVPYYMTLDHATTPPFTMEEMINEYYQYLMHGTGLFSTQGGFGVVGYVNTLNDSPYADIQYFLFNFKKNDPNIELMFEYFGYQDEITKSLIDINKKHELAGLLFTLLNPKSTGRVELNSTCPFDAPKYISNYLQESEDVETLLRSFHIGMKLAKTDALKANGFKEFKPVISGCANEIEDSDDYWRCYIRHLSTTVYHPSGTTKMGPDGDLTAVVDSRLKVKGVKGLRVIDAGIMPNIVSGNTNAPSIMIGEKGADMIKEDWGYSGKDEL